MQWDDEYFYIAAELEEPHVWATLTQHDAVIFHHNDFELFVDPNSDSHEYFEFEMNALNTGWDLFLPKSYKDGGSADKGWTLEMEGVWPSGAHAAAAGCGPRLASEFFASGMAA